MDLTDKQWALLEPLLAGPKKWKPGGRGRPPQQARGILNGILWVMRTGAPWHDIPDRYPSYSTCFRRSEPWRGDGTLKEILTILYDDLRKRGKVDDVESFIDGSYVGAQKGDLVSGVVVPARRPRSWQLQTARVFLDPLASQMVRSTMSASSSKPSTTRLPKTSHRC
jgi:transposase